MSSLGWDLPASNDASTLGYDPYAPAPVAARTPQYYSTPTPAPAAVVTEPVEPATTPASAEPVATTPSALSALLPVAALPMVFLSLRMGLTPLLGLHALSAPWLVVGVLAMVVLALVLSRLLGEQATWLGVLLAVLAAIAETLLVVAPVAMLSAFVATRLTQVESR